MNNNMYNQPNGVNNNVPQAPVQPGPVQPQGQPVYSGTPVAPAPSTNGAAMNNLKNTLSNIDKDSAKKYVGIGSGVLLLLSIFLPYISVSAYGYTMKASIWDGDGTVFKILLIVLSLIPIATFLLQKAKRLSYLSAGYALCFVGSTFDSVEGFSGLSFGFWLMFLATVALIVVCIMEDLPEIKTMLAAKPKVTVGTPTATSTMQVPPVAVPSVPAAPVAPQAPVQPGPVQPVVQNVEVCNFCGQPKRNPADVVCPSCGQRY